MAQQPNTILRIERNEFVESRFRYRPGEHVTLLGPTGSGKTRLAYQLLARAARPSLPAQILVMKPRDATVRAWSKQLHMPRTYTWPPTPRPWQLKPSGWVVWPRHTFDPDYDDALLQWVFRRAILGAYKRGNRIVFADEAAGLSRELQLERVLKTLWMRGRSMGVGLWASSQRPVEIPLHAYSQAEHLFLANDPDLRTRKRYAEIGGIDPRMILDATETLDRHEFLYIRRDGARRCIIPA